MVSSALLGRERRLGLAYVRAVIRTINTHLTGDYREDEDVVDAIAEGTGVAADELRDLPPLLFDWELRAGTMGRIEEELIVIGGVSYDEPLARDTHVDRTLASEAVGASS